MTAPIVSPHSRKPVQISPRMVAKMVEGDDPIRLFFAKADGQLWGRVAERSAAQA